MWLGGETDSVQNVGGGGGEGVYDVLTFQKSRGSRAYLGGGGGQELTKGGKVSTK